MTLVTKQKFANVVILYIAFTHTCYACADITMYKPYLINACNQELIIEVRDSIQHSIGMCKMSA